MTPEQWGLWLRLIYGPAVVMNPLFAFWVNLATVATMPPPPPTRKRGRKV